MAVISRARASETKILEDLLASNVAEFLALYGRRRVGKTFLIREFFQTKSVTYFNATGAKKAPQKEQIKHFTAAIAKSFYAGAPLTPQKNWDETFSLLTDAINKNTETRQDNIILRRISMAGN